jgi:NTP pyrophosphatase (non-canonical NTP hydrolase)
VELDRYQEAAQGTDQVSSSTARTVGVELIVPLLGLAGEAGELLSEYKKQLRDGEAHVLHKERIAEELGDLLWYIANVASKYGLSLSEIASKNLEKTQGRWGSRDTSDLNLDDGYPTEQAFPRAFEVELREVEVAGKTKLRVFVDGRQTGDDLTDNAHDPDGYRFHDVFHFGYVAVLGWSPVIRKLMGRKRRSNPSTDEVEDGGRAQVVDEAISALVFDYARVHNWLEGVKELDFHLLRTVKGMTERLEVHVRSLGEWHKAILLGFAVWRQVRDHRGGRIRVDLDGRTMVFLGPALSG